MQKGQDLSELLMRDNSASRCAAADGRSFLVLTGHSVLADVWTSQAIITQMDEVTILLNLLLKSGWLANAAVVNSTASLQPCLALSYHLNKQTASQGWHFLQI